MYKLIKYNNEQKYQHTHEAVEELTKLLSECDFIQTDYDTMIKSSEIKVGDSLRGVTVQDKNTLIFTYGYNVIGGYKLVTETKQEQSKDRHKNVKTYTITLIEDKETGKSELNRLNDGFNPLELIGLLKGIKDELQAIVFEHYKPKINLVKRTTITD